MTPTEEKIWFALVAEWKNALSRAFAAQVRLNDGVDASIDGADRFPPHEVSATTESLWADEARKRCEMERFIEMHRTTVERGSMPGPHWRQHDRADRELVERKLG